MAAGRGRGQTGDGLGGAVEAVALGQGCAADRLGPREFAPFAALVVRGERGLGLRECLVEAARLGEDPGAAAVVLASFVPDGEVLLAGGRPWSAPRPSGRCSSAG
ncbi:hypothetical protein [Streptomyces sp. NBC_00233]|uniref:hypothetical protein n=1 Tax=Streptomyces sp. NBC_00233 TaxID=2975686 RepID=UPI00225A445F|nr:hypothetical protein [Streptomyces sp. NBC_00233]MCX5232707.1 hypothetical protein [Streptomyces sp. NBC_00233]